MKRKELYASPTIKVVELRFEQAVLTGSPYGDNESLGEETGEGW